MRPPRSLPRTRLRSMPKSHASLRIEGEAGGANPGLPAGAGGASSVSSAGSVGGSAAGCADWAGAAFAGGAGSFFGVAGEEPAALGAAESQPPAKARIRWPTVILSPVLIKSLLTVPAAGEGIEATAFSFSSSRIGWSLVNWSPSLTSKFTTMPESAPSPRLGSLISMLDNLWRDHLRIQPKFLDGCLHFIGS